MASRKHMTPHHRDRAVAFSLQLAQAHRELRCQINRLRASTRQPAPGDVLVTHCLAFCAALTTHHQGEDTGLFTELVRERPDLAGTVAKLVEDHTMITAILSRVVELSGRTTVTAGPAWEDVVRELDGLAAIMESHFAYEERAIGKALDQPIADTGWSGAVFHPR